MAELDDFLNDGGTDISGQAEAHEPSAAAVDAAPVVEEQDPAPQPEPEPLDEIPEDLRGTREALIAERGLRRDWKGQAERAAGELTALRAELEAARKAAAAPPAPPAPVPQAPAPVAEIMIPNPVEDPAGYHAYNQRMLFNERLNISEAMIRDKYDDVDAKLEVFKKAADANPAMRAELMRQAHPYSWMYSQAQRIAALAEVGDDPAAFRSKIEAEVRAKIEAEYAGRGNGNGAAPPQAVALHIPRSLGTAPSSGPRMAAVEEAPDFDDIFKPRKRG